LDFNDGKNAMKYLLSLENKPTAVFAVSDILAIGALKAIKEYNINSNCNISVVGFDNVPFANMTNPTLTTIDQPMYMLGCEAASMLIKIINNQGTKLDNIILEHELIIRESTVGCIE
jgi:LacI family repressor for deo operon, udp, cdd, tsx, nupC, and nupG